MGSSNIIQLIIIVDRSLEYRNIGLFRKIVERKKER
jgi:hypothetical protein